MYNVIGGGYLGVENPGRSRFTLKPLEEDFGGTYHDGDPKIHDTQEAT
jgi:hypothetical protein